jgi:signal transduction histidine kinase
VREALAHIRAASKAALDELRDTIGLLRQPDEAATPTEPNIGLTGLPQLLASFDRAGLTIDYQECGRPRPVTAPVELTAYRIIQESLTNVCKHAGPCAVTVMVDYLEDVVRVTVLNPPTGRPATATRGTGLLGMRERVAALAGVLHAGPRPDGGFAVTASLPVSTPPAAAAPVVAAPAPSAVAPSGVAP